MVRSDTRSRIRRTVKVIWPFAVAVVIFLCVRLAARSPDLVENYYSKGFYPVYALFSSSVSRLFPVSLWDIFWVLVILVFITGAVMVIIRRVSPGTFFLKVFRVLSLMYAFFYISWGFNYFRPDIGKRMGFDVMSVDTSLFRSMLDSVILLTNGHYTAVSLTDYPEMDRSIEISYRMNSKLLDINYPNGHRRPKSMLFSNLIAKFGISGYFGPFFNEINLNRRLLPMEYPFLLAHEKAHQFGVSNEADANLVAFLVCTRSEDPKLNYSGYLALLLYFLEDAQYLSDYSEYLGKLNKPVLDELRFRQQYYSGLQNEVMGKAQETVYDAYLKTNHISRGIENYNQIVELAISWFRHVSKLSI